MTDFSTEKAAEFWERADQQHYLEQAGPFKEPVESLGRALNTYQNQLEKDTIEGDPVLRTPDVIFSYSRDAKSKATNAKAFAFTEEETGNTYLAVDEDTSNPDMYRFKVDMNGLLVNIDDTNDHFGESPADLRLITTAVSQISRNLEQRETREQERRDEMKRRALGWVSGIATFVAIGGVVALGIDKLYFEPHARDKAARKAFDNEQHVLPVGGVVLQSQKVSVVPEADFGDIPSFKKHDDLRSPRTINVTGNNCEVKSVPSRPDDTLLVALADGDPLVGSTIGASVDRTRKHVTICLMGPSSPGQDSKGGPDESKLALQLQPAKK